jgi:hypothetical protein
VAAARLAPQGLLRAGHTTGSIHASALRPAHEAGASELDLRRAQLEVYKVGGEGGGARARRLALWRRTARLYRGGAALRGGIGCAEQLSRAA